MCAPAVAPKAWAPLAAGRLAALLGCMESKEYESLSPVPVLMCACPSGCTGAQEA